MRNTLLANARTRKVTTPRTVALYSTDTIERNFVQAHRPTAALLSDGNKLPKTSSRLSPCSSRTQIRQSSSTSSSSLFSATGSSKQQQQPPKVTVTKTTASSSSLSQESGGPAIISQDSAKATKLVDDLLEYTQSLMHGDDDGDASTKHHIVAYSGGIDSSVVAALLYHSATTTSISNQEKHGNATTSSSIHVRAVLGLSPAVPTEQILLAEQVAQHIGIPLEQIPTTEGTDEVYIENAGQACLACKTHLYTCLESIVQHSTTTTTTTGLNGPTNGPEAPPRVQLYNGTNADDLEDPTRLGLIAADKHNVLSPLRYTTKENVRIVGKHLGLPNWNYAASPCLRSRLAIGVEALPQHLQRIEEAERYVRQSLQLDPTQNLRVRLLSQNRAMIEVEGSRVLEDAQIRLESWRPFFCNQLEFASVNVRQFKSGSVAPKIVSDDTTSTTAVDEEQLQAVAG